MPINSECPFILIIKKYYAKWVKGDCRHFCLLCEYKKKGICTYKNY